MSGLAAMLRNVLRNSVTMPFRRLYRRWRPHPSERESRNIEKIRNLPKSIGSKLHLVKSSLPKKILINSHFAWPYGYVEYSLGAALRERGHEVMMLACGGLPDYCQLQNSTQQRPPCDTCLATVRRRIEAFALPSMAMSDFLNPEDVQYSREVAQSRTVDELLGAYEGTVPIGKLAYYNLFQYLKGFPYEIADETERVFRRCVASAILTTRASDRIFTRWKPDILVTINGKFLQWAPFVQRAKEQSIPFVTWEDYQLTPSTVVFAHNELAHETRHSSDWPRELEKPLTEEERELVRSHFKLWAQGGVTAWAGFGADARAEESSIREHLGISRRQPIISLFPNLAWDSTSVGFERAFPSMFDWIKGTIEYAAGRPDIDFVIRAHPAEGRLPPMWRSPMTTCDAIRRYVPTIPPNVHLVDSSDPINSYALAAISSAAMVYTSTLGIELPLSGIRPWVLAAPYYSGKGFTVDIESAAHLFGLLDRNEFPAALSESEIERAERMVYLARFRGTVDFPFLRKGSDFRLSNWAELQPGGNAIIDELCARIISGRNFLDIGLSPVQRQMNGMVRRSFFRSPRSVTA